MRASAIGSGAIIVAGIYLAVAATVGVGTTVTALGLVAIALVGPISTGMIARYMERSPE